MFLKVCLILFDKDSFAGLIYITSRILRTFQFIVNVLRQVEVWVVERIVRASSHGTIELRFLFIELRKLFIVLRSIIMSILICLIWMTNNLCSYNSSISPIANLSIKWIFIISFTLWCGCCPIHSLNTLHVCSEWDQLLLIITIIRGFLLIVNKMIIIVFIIYIALRAASYFQFKSFERLHWHSVVVVVAGYFKELVLITELILVT